MAEQINQHLLRKLQQAEHILWGKGCVIAAYYEFSTDKFRGAVFGKTGARLHLTKACDTAEAATEDKLLVAFVEKRYADLVASGEIEEISAMDGTLADDDADDAELLDAAKEL